MKKLLVPSDITLLEEKYSNGSRPLTLMERLGLMTMPRMIHFRYTKNDKFDMKKILSKQYDKETAKNDPIVEILKTRQQSIRRKVLAHNGIWMGASAATLFGWYSFRFYDYKSKLIMLPFIAYGGTFVGRWVANFLTGRWWENGRSKTLSELPPKVYFTSPTAKN